MTQLIIITGPSCVGKSPLLRSLTALAPRLMADYEPVVLFNSRPPRPNERDGQQYHFRSREQIEQLRKREGFQLMEVRGDLLAIDLNQLHEQLGQRHLLYEGNTFTAHHLMSIPLPSGVQRVGVFLSPLSLHEINIIHELDTVGLAPFVTEMMRRKLLRRKKKQKGLASLADLQDVERRAASAARELAFANQFDYILINHDGEDSEHWSGLPTPIGDARRTIDNLMAILNYQPPPDAERWPGNLFPSTQPGD